MVDKKQVKKVVSVKEARVKESKENRFLRLAKLRVERVLKSIRILGNCSNKTNYGYSSEQVESMFNTIQIALNNAESKYTPSKTEQESFEF